MSRVAAPEALAEAPTRADPVARALSEVVGGPLGRHWRPHPWWSPVRVLLALGTLVFCVSLVAHTPCTRTHWASDAARYAKMCYSDIPYLYTGRGFVEGLWPYYDNGGRYQVMEYPVGISYLAWFAARITLLNPSGPSLAERAHTPAGQIYGLPGVVAEVDTYFWVTAVLLAGLGLLAVWFLARTHPGRPWDALPFVLSPALLATGLVNWDLLAVACVAGALWAWARGRPVLAGVAIGLGTAAKLYPLFLLGPLLIVAWRERRLRPGLLALVAAAGSWVVVNAPAWVTGMPAWRVFWTFNQERGADWGSVWLLLSHRGHPSSVQTINTVSAVFFAAVCLAVLVLGLVARTPPRLAQLGFLVVAGFLLVNKVYSPQYVLWLLPLAVLARPRWSVLLAWQAAEFFYFAAIWWNFGGWLDGASGTAVPVYDAAIVVRLVAEVALMAVVVRDVLVPRHDVVGRVGALDPPAGRGSPGGTVTAVPARPQERLPAGGTWGRRGARELS